MSFLGKIPLDLKIRESGDKGVPLIEFEQGEFEQGETR